MERYHKVELHLRGNEEAIIHTESDLLLAQLLLGPHTPGPHLGSMSKPNTQTMVRPYFDLSLGFLRGRLCVFPGKDFPETQGTFNNCGSLAESKLICSLLWWPAHTHEHIGSTSGLIGLLLLFYRKAGEVAQQLKSVYCFCRGPQFSSQHPYQVTQTTCVSNSRESDSSGLQGHSTHIHIPTRAYTHN